MMRRSFPASEPVMKAPAALTGPSVKLNAANHQKRQPAAAVDDGRWPKKNFGPVHGKLLPLCDRRSAN
jgi:hypothetical protein